jgi:hypothetical protein
LASVSYEPSIDGWLADGASTNCSRPDARTTRTPSLDAKEVSLFQHCRILVKEGIHINPVKYMAPSQPQRETVRSIGTEHQAEMSLVEVARETFSQYNQHRRVGTWYLSRTRVRSDQTEPVSTRSLTYLIADYRALPIPSRPAIGTH